MRIPLTTSLKIDEFSGGSIVKLASGITNGIVSKRPDGSVYVTQRPAINIASDASTSVSFVNGRGCFFWGAANLIYLVNGYQVYRSGYSVAINEASRAITLTGTGTTATATATAHGFLTGFVVTVSGAANAAYNGTFAITNVAANTFDYASTGTGANTGSALCSLGAGGTGRVYFADVGDYLVILDPDNNAGWTIALASPTTLVRITDPQFPTTLANGLAVLNQRLYVLDETGVIYGSDAANPTSWAALNYLEAELSQDGGVCIAEKDGQVIVFGERTIEFFYDAANQVGSPLSARLDVSYEIGMVNRHSLWNESGIIFFAGKTRSGEIGVYMMPGLEPQKISTDDISSLLTSAVTTDGMLLFGCGFSIGGKILFVLTTYVVVSNVVVPKLTLVYDTNGIWTKWDLAYTDIDHFPLVSFSPSVSSRVGEGMLSNGDIITLADDFIPQDRTLASAVFEAGIFDPGIFSATGASGYNIEVSVVTGQLDFGTRNLKIMEWLRPSCKKSDTSQLLSVQWSNDLNDAWNTARTLDLNTPRQKLRRCGKFVSRNHKLTFSGGERIELDALETEGTGCDA